MQRFENNLAQVEVKLQQMNLDPDQLEIHRANELFNIENDFQRQINALLVDALKPQADALVADFKAARGDPKKEEAFVQKAVVMIDDTDGVSITYTGMVPLFHQAQNELLTSLFESFLLAFLLIWVLMIIWFRSISAGLLTMLPNVFPAAIIFGFMGWTGRIVDIGSMMTASVAMGIAVDDTVHYLTWFRRGLSEGKSRIDALLHAYRRCAIAMAQTTMIAGFGIVVFALSPFQPVAQFGLLMFVLLIAALVGDLVFLPAMLAGPAGRLFQPKEKAETVAEAETQPVA
jgi:predicted RND superfamily exporter protein